MGETRVEGLDELVADWRRECAAIDTDLARGAMKAAGEGIAEAQANHPYTDRTRNLTDSAHVNPLAGGDAEMVWPMPYAGFVDEGTSRAKPYPFTPKASAVAEHELDKNAGASVDKACAKISAKYG